MKGLGHFFNHQKTVLSKEFAKLHPNGQVIGLRNHTLHQANKRVPDFQVSPSFLGLFVGVLLVLIGAFAAIAAAFTFLFAAGNTSLLFPFAMGAVACWFGFNLATKARKNKRLDTTAIEHAVAQRDRVISG